MIRFLILLFVTAAQANLTITDSAGVVRDTCTYSNMAVTPGGVTLRLEQCAGNTLTQSSQQVFGFERTELTVPSGPQQIRIVRNGTLGAYRLGMSPYGAACWGQPESIDFPDRVSSVAVSVNLGTVPGSYCEYYLHSVSGQGVIGPNKVMRLTSQGLVGCPAVPEMLTASFPGVGNLLTHMQASDQVVAIKLLATDFLTAQMGLAPTPGAYSPSPVTIEYSVNECPGKIDLDPADYCNVTTTNALSNNVTAILKPFGPFVDRATANQSGYCWAAKPGVQYYFNARWRYTSCMFSNPVCGFHIMYNRGPY